jgi:hypothetical protein
VIEIPKLFLVDPVHLNDVASPGTRNINFIADMAEVSLPVCSSVFHFPVPCLSVLRVQLSFIQITADLSDSAFNHTIDHCI